jgi:phenylalanyl-tRNA synthetase alpha chain
MLLELKEKALADLEAAASSQELQDLKVKYLGRKGPMTEILRGMGKVPAEERPKIGEIVNQVKQTLEQCLKDRTEILRAEALKAKIANDKVDITLPGRKPAGGHLHPITLTNREIKKIFMHMGFDVVEGPEIDNDYFNFEALNLPKDHPARDMQDTFYVSEDVLLRTHTSPGQIRVMDREKPPIKVLVPGRVFRSDSDATHSPMFHQMEGLVVDKGITLCDLQGMLDKFVSQIFGEGVRTRLRPSYFPFTEPSVEVDVSCFECGGKGCSLCKHTGWIEVLGGGVVHPKVLENCGIDSSVYSGIAFGIGIERITMLKYGINNIGLLFENDLRFLKQF